MSTVLVLSIHEIITPENYKFFKGVVPMDKITHQVRAEHWTKIMNECINSGMSKTAWCRANGISVKQFFYWQRGSCAGKLSRIPGIHHYRQLSDRIRKWRRWCQRLKGQSLLLRSSFHLLLKIQLRFFIRIS